MYDSRHVLSNGEEKISILEKDQRISGGKIRMVDTKKEQERDELHRAIWAIADELRGAVDGWDFKNYVLGTMF